MKEILEILKSMPLEERMEVLNALREYLKYMLQYHPDDLEYLWRYTQQYTNFGGCYTMTFDHWKNKLNKDLEKQEK